jgi:hypothetical protein
VSSKVPTAPKSIGVASSKDVLQMATHENFVRKTRVVAGASDLPKPGAPSGIALSKTAATVTAPRAGVLKISAGRKRLVAALLRTVNGKQARIDVRPPSATTVTLKASVQPQAPAGSDGGHVAYCPMLDSVPSVEPCSSSSLSDTSGSESIMASPPPISNLYLSTELSEPEAEAVQQEVSVETRARVVCPIG